MMTINIDENYFATPKTMVLGNSGEVASRKIKVIQPAVEGASCYIARFSVSGIVYETEIVDGVITVPAVVLYEIGEGYMQWVARDSAGQLIAKSDLISYSVLRSLSDETTPIPAVEDTESALSRINDAYQHAIEGIRQLDGYEVVAEIAEARTAAKTAGTYGSLSERLAADFDDCITDGQLYVVLGNEIGKARKEWQEAIENALGTVETNLSELVNLPDIDAEATE